jgi:molybdopterin-guanine dinucleotide biosynthesis protein A
MKRGELSGVVLAGGRSTRMGRDKARLRVGGRFLWERQARVLAAAGAAHTMVALRAGQRRFSPALDVVRDTRAGLGPIAGVHAALAACETPWLAVLAVDLPCVEAAWFKRLARECRAGGGAVGVNRAGFFEPFAAIYPREILDDVERAMEAGQYSLQPVLRDWVRRRKMRAVRLTRGDAAQLTNWNEGPQPGAA